MKIIKTFNIGQGDDVQTKIDSEKLDLTYTLSNHVGYRIIFQIPEYNGSISIPAGTSFEIISELDKGCIINANNKDRCISSFGASYLSIDNITLRNGVATNKEEYTTNGNIYLSENNFYSQTKYNGGGCCIMGNTIVNIKNVNIDDCYAKGSGGGLYFDPCYNSKFKDLQNYAIPMPTFIIYNNIVLEANQTNGPNFSYKNINGDDKITLSESNDTYSWEYTNGSTKTNISDFNEQYANIPNVKSDTLYVHGYVLDTTGTKTESILSNIHYSSNRRGYQLHLENDTCNIDTNNYISNNKADADGGGIYLNNVSYFINGSKFEIHDNISKRHGGGLCIENTIGSMYPISNNSYMNGGIIHKFNLNMIIKNIECNSNISYVYGGGLYYSDNYNGIIEDSSFKGNECYGSGGGVFISGNQEVSFQKAYYNYNGSYSTSKVMFNGLEYLSNEKGFYNLTSDRYISKIEDNLWGEYKGTFNKDTDYQTTNMNLFGSVIEDSPNYYGWSKGGNKIEYMKILNNIKWSLELKLNNIFILDNKVIESSKFDNRYIHDQEGFIFDIPLLTGGGICLFSSNNITIINSTVERNKSDLYGGGITVFNNLPSVNTLALRNCNNTSTLGKGNNYHFIGDHNFYVNNNTSDPISESDILNDIDTFYTDNVYVSCKKGLKGFNVNYYDKYSKIVDSIPSIASQYINYIALLRDYYELKGSDELLLKGDDTNIINISQSLIKILNNKSILHSVENNRAFTISNFSSTNIRNFYISNFKRKNSSNSNVYSEIEENSGGAILFRNNKTNIISDIIFTNCSAIYGGAISITMKALSNESYAISNILFTDCIANNLGGSIFTYVYDDQKGYDDYEFGGNNSNLLFITNSSFKNCKAINRGGGLFLYYNLTAFFSGTQFIGNYSNYGNDCYISDQSQIINSDNANCNLFLEGSSCSSFTLGKITKGLVYIDDYNTDIFTYDSTSGYKKGIDVFYSEIKDDNIDNIKSQIVGKNKILYQIYDYDYIGKEALKNNTSIIKSYDNLTLDFQSRLVNRYESVYNTYDINNNSIKGITQNYRNALFQDKDYNLTFSNIKAINISRINIKAVNSSFININDISKINISDIISNNCKSDSDGGVINIKGIQSDIDLSTNIELVSNTANKGSGGALYAFLKGVSSFSIGEKATKASIIIADNRAINGGAFYIGSTVGNTNPMTTSSNTNNQNLIEFNSATYGGAFYFDNINAGIANLDIINNYANEGGGIYLGGNSNIDISNLSIKNNSFDTNSMGNFYSKNQALGGGIFISPESYLTIEKDVTIENNLMYWGGGIFNDVNPNKACRIVLKDKNSFQMNGNSNYNIYIVGNIKSVKASSSYNDIKDIENVQIESIDVGIEFINNTKGRFFTYPIKGDPQYDNHNERLDYLFNDYINHMLVKYEDTQLYSTKSSVKSLDIKIYSDDFVFYNDNLYKSNYDSNQNKFLDFININGEMKGFGYTKFESGNNSISNFLKYKGLQFNFSHLSKGLIINNLYFDSFFNKDTALYSITNMNKFIYGNNYHKNIYGYDTTNFIIDSVQLIDIKSDFNSSYYVSRKKAENSASNTLGGFIKVDNSTLDSSNIHFNPSLKGVGSYCYKSDLSIDTDYENYNLPIGGVCYVNNSNLYINEIKSLDGNGSIALDGGFIYKDINDSKIISFKGISLENYNSYHNGGAISLNRTKNIPNTFSLLNFDTIHLNNCNAINGFGGGIYMNTTKANFNEINITDCTAMKGGGGLALISNGDDASTITLNKADIIFKGNIAHSGSQIYVVGSKLIINNINMDGTDYLNELKSNSDLFKGNNGGAIYAESSELQLKSCTFTNFGAYQNGGVIYYDSNYDSNQNYLLHIDNCEFNNKGNDFITKRGGAIYMVNNGSNKKDESIYISNSSIHHFNSTIGGGIFLNNKADRNIVLNINQSNIYNNSVNGNMMNNIDKSSYEISIDPLQLEGFGGGIFMNNIKNITFKGLKAYNNVCNITFPEDDYYASTYNSDNIYTDTLAEYNSSGFIEVNDQIKLDKWNDYFIPCGGGIFMMNGIDTNEIKSSNTSISYNTPDDIFPNYICYKANSTKAGSIQKSEIYKALHNINSDDAYIESNTHVWSLVTGSQGGRTDYYNNGVESFYGKGGMGTIVEFTNKLDIGNVNSINYIIGQKRTMDEKSDYYGSGGRGAYIFYSSTPSKNIYSNSSTVYLNT